MTLKRAWEIASPGYVSTSSSAGPPWALVPFKDAPAKVKRAHRVILRALAKYRRAGHTADRAIDAENRVKRWLDAAGVPHP